MSQYRAFCIISATQDGNLVLPWRQIGISHAPSSPDTGRTWGPSLDFRTKTQLPSSKAVSSAVRRLLDYTALDDVHQEGRARGNDQSIDPHWVMICLMTARQGRRGTHSLTRPGTTGEEGERAMKDVPYESSRGTSFPFVLAHGY